MNAASQSDNPLVGLSQVLTDLLDQGVRMGTDVFETLSRGPLGQLAASMQTAKFPSLPKSCGCDIPPPCWMPKPLGDLVSHVCPGGAATVRLLVTNCSIQQRVVQVVATGKDAGKVKVTPASATLGPMEQAAFVASLAIGAEAAECESHDVLLWVRGCHLHFLRWRVEVRARGGHACHEVDVQDCPDLVHHWYDHFYCQRPCPTGQQRVPEKDAANG
jgi:hypothetical protein